MFTKRKWEVILVSVVLGPGLETPLSAGASKSAIERREREEELTPKDGSKTVITVKARTKLGALMEAQKTAKLYSMCHLKDVAYLAIPQSIKPII